jgi:hypothetical protein
MEASGYKRSHFGDEVVVDFAYAGDAHQEKSRRRHKKTIHDLAKKLK